MDETTGPKGARDGSGRRRRTLAIAVSAVVALVATGCISSATVTGGVLTIVGSEYGDTITLRLAAGNPNRIEVDDGADPALEYEFDGSILTSIVVDVGAGADTIVVDESNGTLDLIPIRMVGGAGNDTFIGGSGAERIEGGPGADVIEGNDGNDQLFGGDDADRFTWDEDGNDTVDGGAGADRQFFNSNGGAELTRVTNVLGHARVIRTAPSNSTDLDNVEALDLSPRAGADTIDIGNLAPTDLTSLTLDLAMTGGVADGAVDLVVVPPTSVIGRDGVAARVTGIGPELRVLNGSGQDRISVNGTAAVDTVQLDGSASADVVAVTSSGLEAFVIGLLPGLTVDLDGVEVLDVDLGDSDDQLSASSTSAAVTLDVTGGNGRDTITGSNGADVIDAGPDADLIDGNQGNDVLRAGDGSDVLVWNPGDGNDTVVGGTGSDRLVFTGYTGSEFIGLANQGGHVRVTRNVDNVVLDVDDVELFDVKTLLGTDGITVDSLAGTDATSVEVDLSPDGQQDQVTVNGTPNDDTISVVGVGGAVEVLGLSAVVRVVAPDTGLDRLPINGLTGTDTITPTPSAAALIVLILNP